MSNQYLGCMVEWIKSYSKNNVNSTNINNGIITNDSRIAINERVNITVRRKLIDKVKCSKVIKGLKRIKKIENNNGNEQAEEKLIKVPVQAE